MVVRLDLEDSREAVTDIDRPGVLARSLQHLRSVRRQRPQVHARALVAAVLGPHHREDAELGHVRLAAEETDDALVFVGLQPVAFENLGIDHVLIAALGPRYLRLTQGGPFRPAAVPVTNDVTIDWRMTSPSTLPSSGSQARSGCGIMPATFRASLQRPAMAFTEPFGLASSSRRPSAVV